MSKKNKNKKLKKIIAPVSMLLVLALLVGGWLWLKDYNEKLAAEENKEAELITVIDKSNKTVTHLSLTTDETLAFTYENEKWIYDADDKFPVNNEAVAKVALSLAKIEVETMVDPDARAEDKEYGLDKPPVVAVAKFSDGTEFTYSFGDVNDYKSCQYFTVSGDENVYLAETTFSASLAKGIEEFIQSETFPLTADGITSDSVSSIVLETSGGTKKEIKDDEGIEDLLTYVKVMNLSSWEDYYADEKEMAETYGISEKGNKVTVNYAKNVTYEDEDGKEYTSTESTSYTLYIGADFKVADDEDAELAVFYSPKGSTIVYSADKETVDNVMSFLLYDPNAETTATTEKEG